MEVASSHRVNHLLLVVFLLLLLSPTAFAVVVIDTFNKSRNITDNDTLVSAGGNFTLGFFSPGTSTTKRYLGIWYTGIPIDAVCWVANRDHPISDSSGVLAISDAGNLALLDGSGRTAWSSNSSGGSSAVAQLLDTGELVVHDGPGSRARPFLWHSFDHPSNTMLPGMVLGKNLRTGLEWYLASWRAADDPATGDFRRVLDTGGVPDLVVLRGGNKTFRSGPWNGLYFSGVPVAASYADLVRFEVASSSVEITYTFDAKPGAPPTRIVLRDDGLVERQFWEAGKQKWTTYFDGPADECDSYGRCGAFGLCDMQAQLHCGCVPGFVPASPLEWQMRDYAGGCRRNVTLGCGHGGTTTDGFLLIGGVKLPDTDNASVDNKITVDECRARCLANCTCLAYAAADIRGAGTGCIIWTDGIIDLRRNTGPQGQDLYLRLANTELPSGEATVPPPQPPPSKSSFPTALVTGATIGSLVVTLLIVLLVLVVIKKRQPSPTAPRSTGSNSPPSDDGQLTSTPSTQSSLSQWISRNSRLIRWSNQGQQAAD